MASRDQPCGAPKSAAPYTETTGYEVITSAGATIHTFDEEQPAKDWALRRMKEIEGLQLLVEEVTRTVRRRRITWLRRVA